MEALTNMGIDVWSILLYVVNMGLLLALLSKYLFPKILHFLDERQKQIRGNLEEAERLKAEMAKQNAIMSEEKEAMRGELQREFAETKKELEAKRKAADAEIEAKRAKMLEEVRLLINGEKERLIASTQDNLLKMVQRMILSIVSEDLPKDMVEKSVLKAWEKFKDNQYA